MIINGQPVNAKAVNDAFMSKTSDATTTGRISTTSTVPSTDPTNGSIQTTGGVGIEGSLNVGGTIKVNGVTVEPGATLKVDSNLSDLADATIARTNLGLGNVDNTSDLSKPVSTATQAALDLKASTTDLASKASTTYVDSGLALKQDAATAVTLAGVQTLTNKTLADAVINTIIATEQTVKPSSPSAGSRKIYVKDDGKAYLLDSTGTETQLGSGGGGSGGINYISNPSFDENTIGWVISKNTTATVNPDSGFVTTAVTNEITRSTTLPLRGAASGLFTLGAVGNQLYFPVPIADADKGKVLAVTFDYAIASGTYADDAVQVWIYDVTNNVFIQPTPFKIKNTGLVSERMLCEFQTSHNSNSYRLVLHQALASTAVLKIDNFIFGPQGKLYGSPVTGLKSAGTITLTSTGTSPNKGTTSIDRVQWQQIGDQARFLFELRISASGTTGSGDYLVQLPSGLSFDSTKVSFHTAGSFDSSMGLGIAKLTAIQSGQAFLGTGVIVPYDATRFRVFLTYANVNTNTVYGAIWGSGNMSFALMPFSFSADFMAPILGWQSQVVMSNDADTRVVAARYASTLTQTIGTQTIIDFNSRGFDTAGAVTTGSAWKYIAQVSGYYEVDTAVHLSGVNPLTVELFINGISHCRIAQAHQYMAKGSDIIFLKAGDYFDLRGTASNIALQGAASLTYMSVSRISGPSQIAASEFIGARYTATAATTSSPTQPLNFTNVVYDNLGCVTVSSTAWRFTSKGAAWYGVKVSALPSATGTTGTLYKNGVFYCHITNTTDLGGNRVVTGSDDIYLLDGEYFDFRFDQSATSAAGNYTKIAISKLNR